MNTADPVVDLIDEYGRLIVPAAPGEPLGAPHAVVPPLPADLAARRSGRWPAFLKAFLAANPLCAGCGRKAETGHHDRPFHEHPELELVAANIDPVCVPCHFVLCHAGDWHLTVDTARARLKRNLSDMAKVRR